MEREEGSDAALPDALQVGRCNYTDDEALKKLSDLIKFANTHYAGHNAHESDYFAPILKAKGGDAAKIVDAWTKEHDEHVTLMKSLNACGVAEM